MKSAITDAVGLARRDLDFLRLDGAAFAASPSNSIDYAVMEKAEGGIVVSLDAGWSDIGAWDALAAVGPLDAHGNYVHGDTLLEGASGNIVYAQSRLVAAIGVDNIVIVETPDAVLVADKHRAQDVKAIVAELKRSGRPEGDFHKVVHRPWGSYETLAEGPRYQVKRLIVRPEAALSLQKHHHRAEHWVVVRGTAKVTRGDEELLLGENQSTYIPLGTAHRLQNPGKIDLEIIEVQSGAYLGEDDIVRFEDHYGRQQA
jgi:mannose-1-phosphate guanylyltransferase/mannose-6-phosphate isomerase